MRSTLLLIVTLFLATSLLAQSSDEIKSVQLQASIQESPAAIQLNWDSSVVALEQVQLHRRLAGTNSWGAAYALLDSLTHTYLDADLDPGEAYEYRITRRSEEGFGFGYLYSSTALAAPPHRGILILVVDEALLPELEPEIQRYQKDVTADGWLVKRIEMEASQPDTVVKQAILDLYQQAPEERHALFLLGHIAVPYSGNISPDGHSNHVGAWAADVFYADVDGNWTDQSINNTSASREANHNVPGDGKWDQSSLPSDVELEMGRVDLSALPVFEEDMISLTRRYLDKNHAYRQGHFQLPARGLIENNFGSFAEGFGQNGLKNFSTLVGRDSTRYLDYNTLKSEGYLLSYGCGGGSYQGAGGISNSSTMATDSFQTVFTFLFGSYFGDWDVQNNFLRAALGSGTILTNAWAGRPNWNIHPMAMGKTIGYCTKLTQSNSGFSYSAGFGNRSIHIALMGDPSLRMYVLAPPAELQLEELPEGIQLEWVPSPATNLLGYHVYRRSDDTSHFVRITDYPLEELSYLDPCPGSADSLQYLVKAIRLETSPSGRFYNESIGTSAGLTTTIDRTLSALFTPLINGNTVIFTNQSTNAQSYSWDFGDGDSSMEFEPTHNFEDGSYQVVLAVQNGCTTDTIQLEITVGTVGTSTSLAELGIQLLPNPVTEGWLYFQLNSLQETKVQLYDILGRQRKTISWNNQLLAQWDLRNLESGQYILLLEQAGQIASQRIIIHTP